MKFKVFNARYRALASSLKTRIAEERAVEDTHLILQRIEQKHDLKQHQSEISMSYAFGKRHIFLRYAEIVLPRWLFRGLSELIKKLLISAKEYVNT